MRKDKSNSFPEIVDKFFNKPLPWSDLHANWDELKGLSWDDLKMSLSELVFQKEGESFDTIIILVKGWLLYYKNEIPQIFRNTQIYPNLVVLMTLKLLINSNLAEKWFSKQIINKTGISAFGIHGPKDLKQEALIKLTNKQFIDRLIRDIKHLEKRIEPYLTKCAKNLLLNFIKKQKAEKRYAAEIVHLDDMDVLSGNDTGKACDEQIMFEAIKRLVTPRQFELLILKYDNPKLTSMEIAKQLKVSDKTVKREKEAIRKNAELLRILKI